MAHLIAPIDIDGTPLCCQPATKRTEAILSGSATEIATNHWEIYRAYKGEGTKSGSVKFGICCATGVTITLTGQIETLNDDFDFIQVLHNGVEVFYRSSTDTSDDEDETVPVGPFSVTLTLTDRPCGHIIEITGSTKDHIANNDVWWRAEVSID